MYNKAIAALAIITGLTNIPKPASAQTNTETMTETKQVAAVTYNVKGDTIMETENNNKKTIYVNNASELPDRYDADTDDTVYIITIPEEN